MHAYMFKELGGIYHPRKFRKYGAVWCVLMYILMRLCLEKFPKINIFFIAAQFCFKMISV